MGTSNNGQEEAIKIAEQELPKEEGLLFLRALQANFDNLLNTSRRQVRAFFSEVWRDAKAHERNDRFILRGDY